jgi:hypothetical protein
MIGVQREPVHQRAAKPCLQALEQPLPVLRFAARVAEQARVRRGQRRQLASLEPESLGRAGEDKCAEALAQQAQTLFRVAARRGETDPDARRRGAMVAGGSA